MQLVHVYLNFPGTTEEAFRFYETVFGTRIAMMQTFGDTPFMPERPRGARRRRSCTRSSRSPRPCTSWGATRSKGSARRSRSGNNFHISVVAKDKAEADRAFAALSARRGGHDAARERAVGAVLRDVRRSLRRAVDGEPADPRLRPEFVDGNHGSAYSNS